MTSFLGFVLCDITVMADGDSTLDRQRGPTSPLSLETGAAGRPVGRSAEESETALFPKGSRGVTHPHRLVCPFPKGRQPGRGRQKVGLDLGRVSTSPTPSFLVNTPGGFQTPTRQFSVRRGAPGALRASP